MDKKSLQNLRKDYTREALDVTEVDNDPFAQFAKWFQEALKAEIPEPNAMTLATAGNDGKPSLRIVLLKGMDHGVVFFTNYTSKKGQHLAENPQASINFFWPELERQVRIEGKVEKVSAEESDEYFHSRPYESQLGAHVSDQSSVIANREVLEQHLEELKKQHSPESIKRPAHWGGYRLIPTYFEFWQGRASRLHDRVRYALVENSWKIARLAP